MKMIVPIRSRFAAVLIAGAFGTLVSSAGCGGDNDYVRGEGAIDVPRPSGMITPEEAAEVTGAEVTGETPAPDPAP